MKWSQKDLEYLKEIYPSKTPIKEILKHLKRSKKAVSHKAVRLGLFRPNIPINRSKDKNHRKKYDRAYYKRNSKKIYLKKKERELNYKLEMMKNLGDKCNICGYNKCPAALEFHHKAGNKEKEISILLKWVSKEKILKEVKKCVLLCANCHRELHFTGL